MAGWLARLKAVPDPSDLVARLKAVPDPSVRAVFTGGRERGGRIATERRRGRVADAGGVWHRL